MDSLVFSIDATVPIFLVMILGWIIKRLGVIDDHFADKANKYVFNVALPAMLFLDIAKSDLRKDFDLRFVLYCMLVTTLCFVIVWVIAELLVRDKTIIGSFVQGSFRSSAAILGLAFIQNMYSDVGMAPLMIVSAVPLYNIFSVVVLTVRAGGGAACNGNARESRENIIRVITGIFTNPIIIAIFLGLPFSMLGIEFPFIISKTISTVGSTATPIALVVIGAGFEGRKAIKKVKPAMIATTIKLVIQCLIFLPIAVLLGFRNQELISILIMLGSPATVSCYIMARNMKNDAVLASSIVVLTTLFSSFTLTGWIFLLRLYGLV